MRMKPAHLFLLVALLAATVRPGAAEVPCSTYAPFAGLPGAELTRTVHTSKDQPPVVYAMYRGFVPSFDGLPMSVDVTIPCDASGPIPLVTMAHGWTDDKTIWEETGRSDTVMSETRRGPNSHWNNIWFASRGYAVLNYTARGWHDSCGPQTPGAIDRVVPAPQCRDHAYWIHMSDQRWEVRDTAWLTGGLVESGVADASRLAITGGSYGGGTTIMNAVLGDRIVCGGDATPASLGSDPCSGKADGATALWKTRTGTPLRWRVSIPMYTWSDVFQVLLPNGRGTDGALLPDGNHADPVGIPIASYLVALYGAGQPLGNGFFAPPLVDPTADITTLTARSLAGNPFPHEDPLVAEGIHQFRTFKSAIGIEPGAHVPIFWPQGLTDPLFSAFESIQMANRLRAFDPNYPIKLFFGDLGHDYASERVDEWDTAHEMMNAFLDHYLTGAGPAPTFDVTAAITRCLNHDDPMELVTAPSWGALHTRLERFSGAASGVSLSGVIGKAGLNTDPVTTASIPGPQAYKGCRIVEPSPLNDMNSVTFSFPVSEPVTLLGGPVVALRYATTANDTELNVRLWDVAPDGTRALVTRGTYRSLDGPGTDLTATFQIAPIGYRFPAGHTIMLDVTANDAPYRQTSNIPAALKPSSATLTLPVR
jgi:predicted acyl esterase